MCRGEYHNSHSVAFDNQGSYRRQDQGCSGHHESHSYTSSSRSGIRGRPTGDPQDNPAKWRWNCCNCSLGNLSYNYDTSCPGCNHRRDPSCSLWAIE
ncbi:hypothetical protein F4782DRAFT_370317 [Xylaria castorea]|nr:hypothetical protein F4782DRAFT_370317 [Xylaria castorea]